MCRDPLGDCEHLFRYSCSGGEAGPNELPQGYSYCFSKNRTAQRYLSLTRSLGRAPLPAEFEGLTRLVDRFGSIQRVERIASSLLDSDTLATAREEKRVNILTYIAMLRQQGLYSRHIRRGAWTDPHGDWLCWPHRQSSNHS